jgi:hypothetical protein
VSIARSISIEFSSGESKTKDVEDEEMYEIEKIKEDKNEGIYINHCCKFVRQNVKNNCDIYSK